MLNKARIWVVLALALTLAGTLLPSVARAHDGDFHATAVAEGGSTKFTYDIPGAEPPQEFWLDGMAAIKHRYDVGTGKNFYRATFKVNSWKGIFSENDDIWVDSGDSMATDYHIRLGLLLYDTNTGITTPLATYDSWITSGNGYSYGCMGDGREVEVIPQPTKLIVADLWVWGTRKYYSVTYAQWRNVPYGAGYHRTRSYRMGSVWVPAEPSSLGHGYETDPMTGYFISAGSSPQSQIRGYCPLWTVVF
jgi:hypothetical protein